MEHAPAKLAALRDSRMSYSWNFNPGPLLVDLDEYLVDVSGVRAELPHLIDPTTGKLHVAYYQFIHRRLHTAAMVRLGLLTPYASSGGERVDHELIHLRDQLVVHHWQKLTDELRPQDRMQQLLGGETRVTWEGINDRGYFAVAAGKKIDVNLEEVKTGFSVGATGWTMHHVGSMGEYVKADNPELSEFFQQMATRIGSGEMSWLHGHVALLLMHSKGIGGVMVNQHIFVVHWDGVLPRETIRDVKWRELFGLSVDLTQDDDFRAIPARDLRFTQWYNLSKDPKVPFVKQRVCELAALSGVDEHEIDPWPFHRWNLSVAPSFSLSAVPSVVAMVIERDAKRALPSPDVPRRRVKTTPMKSPSEVQELKQLEEWAKGRKFGDAQRDLGKRVERIERDVRAGKYPGSITDMPVVSEEEFLKTQKKLFPKRSDRMINVLQ